MGIDFGDVRGSSCAPFYLGSRCFTLVEVVLGLAVIAFGLISIIALFPVGLQATRDSITETYAADNADEMLHMVALEFKNRTSWAGVEDTLPNAKPGATEPGAEAWGEPWKEEATATIWRGGSLGEFVRFEQSTLEGEHVDFSAVGRMWLSPVDRWDDSGAGGDLPYDNGIRINFEISWPAKIPYIRRRKSLYQLEVFNPTPPSL